MIHYFFKLSNFVPLDCRKTVFDIDYNKLYEKRCRIILMDLDNTLIPYDEEEPSKDHLQLFNKLKAMGFQIIIMSNNKEERVKRFADIVECEYIFSATKPLKRGYKRALKKLVHYDKKEIISVGDQLMTDVLGSSRLDIPCILVKPIKTKTEQWFTKINRWMERQVLDRLKIHYPDEYQKIMKLKE